MTPQIKNVRPALCTSVALLMLAAIACDEPAKNEAKGHATPSATVSAPPPKPFELPPKGEVKLAQLGDWVDRARNKLPKDEMGKLDAWLKEVVHVPVEVQRESKRLLADVGEITCGYDTQLVCSFNGKLSKAAKYIVGSQLVCLDSGNKARHRADWKIPPLTKRGELLPLPVDGELMRKCFEAGGEKVRFELVGSPCVVPFPRQMRCAGEYSTCLHRCQDSDACEQICDKNRRSCLSLCRD